MTVEEPTALSEDAGTTKRRRSKRTRVIVAGVAIVVALAAIVLVWFEPQTLFFDDKVDEAFPAVETADAGTPDAGAEFVELASGRFVSLDHTTTGTALVAELADGGRVLRLEDLDTSNGPDLFVYLSTAPLGAAEDTLDDEIVNLGRLKGNIGNQNYDIPADVDLSRYQSVVIWCNRFSVAFGAAPLA